MPPRTLSFSARLPLYNCWKLAWRLSAQSQWIQTHSRTLQFSSIVTLHNCWSLAWRLSAQIPLSQTPNSWIFLKVSFTQLLEAGLGHPLSFSIKRPLTHLLKAGLKASGTNPMSLNTFQNFIISFKVSFYRIAQSWPGALQIQITVIQTFSRTLSLRSTPHNCCKVACRPPGTNSINSNTFQNSNISFNASSSQSLKAGLEPSRLNSVNSNTCQHSIIFPKLSFTQLPKAGLKPSRFRFRWFRHSPELYL